MPGRKGLPPEMISPEEMAPRMGMGAVNIRNAIYLGVLPIGFAFKPTGNSTVVRVPRAEFEAYMAGKRLVDVDALATAVAEKLAAMQLKERELEQG